MMEEYLQNIYYSPKHPAAYTSFNKLYQFVKKDRPDIKKQTLRDWLRKQEIYGTHLPVKRKTKRPRVVTFGVDTQWDGDSAFMLRYEGENDGYKYFTLFIDIFTRYVWTRPLKNLTGKEMVKVLTDIFEIAKPRKLRTDKGSEFSNKDVRKYLKKENVHHFFTKNESKANYAERSIKNIKKRLVRYMDYKQSFKWWDVLADITDSYNNTFHSSIGMTPAQAREENPSKIWHNQYDFPLKRLKKVKKPKNKSHFIYNIGDNVRVSFLKNIFDREYDQKWSTEIFTIYTRKMKQNIPVYAIKDYDGDVIEGDFYGNELQKVIQDDNKVYRIEKVLQKRKKNKKTEVLVKWVGWPRKFNSWLPESSISDYK